MGQFIVNAEGKIVRNPNYVNANKPTGGVSQVNPDLTLSSSKPTITPSVRESADRVVPMRRPMPKEVAPKERGWLDSVDDENERQRMEDVYNATNLEEALQTAKSDMNRETQTSKRLANNAFWSSLASTVGALGKFGVVAASKDGRDVNTGDAAEGMRKAYDESMKRRDKATEDLKQATNASANFKAQLLKSYQSMQDARNLKAMDWNFRRQMLADQQQGRADMEGLRAANMAQRDATRHGYKLEEQNNQYGNQSKLTGQRIQGQLDVNAQGNEARAEQAAAARENANDQKEKDRKAAEERARIAASGGRYTPPAQSSSSQSGSASGGSSSTPTPKPKESKGTSGQKRTSDGGIFGKKI